MITTARTLDDLDICATAVTETAIRLRIERRHLANQLNPASTPHDDSKRQYSTAASDLALDAVEAALDASANPAATLAALRAALDLFGEHKPTA